MKEKILVSGSLAFDRIMDFPGRFKDNILPDKIHLQIVSLQALHPENRGLRKITPDIK